VVLNNLSWKRQLLLTFFALQLVGMIIGRFTQVKYFLWAPYDEISTYTIQVDLPSGRLDEQTVESRYRQAAVGRENRSIHNLISIIKQYESTYGALDKAKVKLTFVTNGIDSCTWWWPQNQIIGD